MKYMIANFQFRIVGKIEMVPCGIYVLNKTYIEIYVRNINFYKRLCRIKHVGNQISQAEHFGAAPLPKKKMRNIIT